MSAFDNKVDLELLRQIADLEKVPQGAYNIRKDGGLDSRASTANIEITTKEDKPGIEIRISSPVLRSASRTAPRTSRSTSPSSSPRWAWWRWSITTSSSARTAT